MFQFNNNPHKIFNFYIDISGLDENFFDKSNIDTQQQLQIQQKRLRNHQKSIIKVAQYFQKSKLSNSLRELP
ncbi:unnamed protein product (macronuclear) [Paramecium tetraurelia]|uniref:Uncharacterized protein n=1 Tax=Paramecium tetraurelia TaxID=5888 RepID=A0ECP7_PARTE|nr:uncharacterized protein GSPATT00003933001 [Paramecium tetraurelia]CAK93064.1 unnamed protein product [Paramecium tetraurelia]|eukprot:XP_001460461.1 hypothetical protein (macronuclear) [Paramecium tetraurelia strain d4-2]